MNKKGFRYDINGLRAIAVSAVVLYHFSPDILPGGFVGVDIFFVISGYLMAKIIFGQLKEERFNFWMFYKARARRIIPPLLAMVCAVFVFGASYLMPPDFSSLSKHVYSSLLFFSNIIYLRETGYFTVSAHELWLLHTWSLSVEWQFYLLFPALIWILNRFLSKTLIRFVLVAVTLTSFVASLYLSQVYPDFSFYSLFTRAWELLAGAVVYLFKVNLPPARRRFIYYAGMGLVLAAILFIDAESAWPNTLTLIPVFGSMLILWGNQQQTILATNPVVQFLGRISYSLYLWHWPVIVWANYQGYALSVNGTLFSGFVALILASLSYYLIERMKISYGGRYLVIGVYLSMLVVPRWAYTNDGDLAIFKYLGDEEQKEFYRQFQRDLYITERVANEYRLECDFYDNATRISKSQIAPSCTEKKHSKGVFLWGDSHAQALSLGLSEIVKANGGYDFYQVASSGCSVGEEALDRLSGELKKSCKQSNEYALLKIESLKPNVIVIAQRYGYLNTDFEALALELKAFGVQHVIVLGPLPEWHPTLPMVIIKRYWEKRQGSLSIPSRFEGLFDVDNELFARYEYSENLRFVSILSKVCENNLCPAISEGKVIAWDYGHLTPTGSQYFSAAIKNELALEKIID
ncbi:acyltransferase family protein [Agarivorans aestuarii]|uniref:Acyltransferase family protein n=1 Tax=Agarivorans aestuarii TaxID=1563703 RepID=A0ABU7G9P5_9ALTE|nr:acyltransferase family protein [Agarivorans aestuarii]MEE1676028.1 acyltransferase family protein [Agarivorans aestuarii]